MKGVQAIVNRNAGTLQPSVVNRLYRLFNEVDHAHLMVRDTSLAGIDSYRPNVSDLEDIISSSSDMGITDFVIIGGDGSVHDAANGIVNSGRDPAEFTVSVVPSGCGNDFARGGLGIDNVEDALRAIYFYYDGCGKAKTSDLIKVTTNNFHRLCVNSVDAAYGSYLVNFLVNNFFGRMVKKLFKSMCYSVAVPLTCSQYQSSGVTIYVNGGDFLFEQDNFLANLQNSCMSGGEIEICPGAEIDDGSLDLIVVGKQSFARTIRLLLDARRGNHVDGNLVKHIKGVNEVEIYFGNGKNRSLILDGELFTMPRPIRSVNYALSKHKIRFVSAVA